MGIIKRILLLIFILALAMTSTSATFNDKVDLHGGEFPTKSMSRWELHKYKDTTLLRREPLCWCPFKSYLLVNQYVTIEDKNNRNYLCINEDLTALVKEDAEYNKAHAPKFKGTAKQKVKKIYEYCWQTAYMKHVKFARNVFEDRQGDCAAVASAFYVCCKKNGIPVRYVIGWADGECHAWNRVKIGKTWYWIDPTLRRWLWKPQYDGRTVMEIW